MTTCYSSHGHSGLNMLSQIYLKERWWISQQKPDRESAGALHQRITDHNMYLIYPQLSQLASNPTAQTKQIHGCKSQLGRCALAAWSFSENMLQGVCGVR